MSSNTTQFLVLSTLAIVVGACPASDDRDAALTTASDVTVSAGNDAADDGDDDAALSTGAETGRGTAATAADGDAMTTSPSGTTTADGEATTSDGSDGAAPSDGEGSSGGSNVGVCDPTPQDGDCNQCTKVSCCAELSACDEDATCACVIACIDDGGNPNGCQSDCGAAPLFDALTGCVIGSCLALCV